jgi:transglutaminase-like putative cysteine protease
MRASDGFYPSALARYGVVDVPHLGRLETPSAGSRSRPLAVTIDPVAVPLRTGPGDVSPPVLAGSPYARVETLARRLAARRATSYGVVVAIQHYLRSNYRYSESPPARFFPLPAFLFRDRIGYCQQFSGAMALMLRMAGIPSRVVGGFAPGDRTKSRFTVSDFDAHSWVEVYFNGIGWVTFDPTPPAAPAIGRTAVIGRIAQGPRPIAPFRTGSKGTKVPSPGSDPDQAESGGAPLGWIALVAAIAASLAAAAILHRRRVARLRSLAPAALAELQAAELERAAAELTGRGRRPGITLRGLESRLRGGRQAAAATYATQLRDCLYGPGPATPDASLRRAARRELAKRQGFGARLRSWLLMPPGGPLGPRGSRPA